MLERSMPQSDPRAEAVCDNTVGRTRARPFQPGRENPEHVALVAVRADVGPADDLRS